MPPIHIVGAVGGAGAVLVEKRHYHGKVAAFDQAYLHDWTSRGNIYFGKCGSDGGWALDCKSSTQKHSWFESNHFHQGGLVKWYNIGFASRDHQFDSGILHQTAPVTELVYVQALEA